MGFFDLFKKKQEPQKEEQQEQNESLLEVEGFDVAQAEDTNEIVLNVDTELGITAAINQAVHEAMDEETITFHEKAGGVLYQENDDLQAEQQKSFADVLEEAEDAEKTDAEDTAEAVEQTEVKEDTIEAADVAYAAEGETEAITIETSEAVYEAESEAEGKAFAEQAADFVAEQISQALETTGEVETEPQAEAVAPNAAEDAQPVQKKGLFARLKEGLNKTRNSILGGVDAVLGSFTKIDEDLFEELEETLIMADMGVQTTMNIVENLRKRVKKERITDPSLIKGMLIEEITEILEDGVQEEENLPSPSVMLVIGVNGVGKTTTIGKLAHNFKDGGKKVLLAAADTFRAAAIDQLEVWGNRAGIEVIKHEENADPAAVVFDAVHAARNRKSDLLICDTAGRLHNKKNLMEELRKISRVIEREYTDAHKETYLVLDATTGQNALQQAKLFMEVAEITGIILTKLDGTAKGGIVVAIKSELKIPVRYIGVGEGIEDLQKFHAAEFAQALFGSE